MRITRPRPEMERVSRFGTLLALLILGFASACAGPSPPPTREVRVPVTTEVAQAGFFAPSLHLLGQLQPALRTEIRAPQAGRIAYARRFATGLRTGADVRAGELLFTLESEDLRLRRAEAEVHLRAKEADLERAKQGVEEGFVAQAQLDEATFATELARERLASARLLSERLRVVAPGAGVLYVETVVPPGVEVNAGSLLTELSGSGAPLVEAWASASQLEQIALGQTALLRPPGGRSEAGRGEIREIDREISASGTVRVIVKVSDARVLPPVGSGLEVEVLLEERQEAFSLPEEAVVYQGGSASIFVLEPAGKDLEARRRNVLTGSRGGGRVEILDGLRAEEVVAVSGVELLADGTRAIDTDTKVGP